MTAEDHPVEISVVIPTLNEEDNIVSSIDSALGAEGVEVIVADGESSDRTVKRAVDAGARTIICPRGRAGQMNAGASTAKGDILLFLHADTRLPEGYDQHLRRVVGEDGVAAGAFGLSIDGPEQGLRIVEALIRFRSAVLGMPYGDQAIFMNASIFRKLGGFPKIAVMEDFALMRRLKRLGRIAIVPEQVLTSSRRWLTVGLLRTTLINQSMIMAWFFGVPPERIARWYNGGEL